MKKIIFSICIIFAVWACSSPNSQTSGDVSGEASQAKNQPVDDGKGVGEIKEVKLNSPLDEGMVERGKAIYDLKCSACHKLTASRVVGPGFKGVTERRKPEWIMNMITNVEMMLAEDAAAQKLLEECLTRMPNQNVSVDDARDILEFLLKNDASE